MQVTAPPGRHHGTAVVSACVPDPYPALPACPGSTAPPRVLAQTSPIETMSDADQREELTYDTATPEQVAQAREAARRKLAEADARWSRERREQLRRQLGLDSSAA
jgi:hypothetical protein